MPSFTTGLKSFTVAVDHSLIYLPEQMVVYADDHKERNERSIELKELAHQYDIDEFSLCAQKDLLEEASKDAPAITYQQKRSPTKVSTIILTSITVIISAG